MKYEKPHLEILELIAEDIICGSLGDGTGNDGGSTEGGWNS